MSSKRGRVVNSWNFPEGRLMKTVAIRLHDLGLRGRALEARFAKLIPHWKTYFSKPISDNAIAQRADKARRYKNEAPEKNPWLRGYWSLIKTMPIDRPPMSRRWMKMITQDVEGGGGPRGVDLVVTDAAAKPRTIKMRVKTPRAKPRTIRVSVERAV